MGVFYQKSVFDSSMISLGLRLAFTVEEVWRLEVKGLFVNDSGTSEDHFQLDTNQPTCLDWNKKQNHY